MKTIRIQGVEVLLEEAEKYIQINDIGEGDLLAVWEPLRLRYPGFEVNLCFRDVPVPENALAAIGAEVLEDCLKMYVTQGEHVPHESPDISLLTKADFGGFAALHDTLPDMWWTSRRIWEKWEGWHIPVLREKGNIIGYAMLMVMGRTRHLGEVFAVEAADPAHRRPCSPPRCAAPLKTAKPPSCAPLTGIISAKERKPGRWGSVKRGVT
jgi:hypothetical protein